MAVPREKTVEPKGTEMDDGPGLAEAGLPAVIEKP